MNRVFINPGHMPGLDPGAVNRNLGYQEAEIVLDIGAAVAHYLGEAGCIARVMQSHNLWGEEPAYPCVIDTANKWKADIFVSLHCNSSGRANTASGTECWAFAPGTQADTLARCVQAQIVSSLGTYDRGVRYNPDYAVLKLTNMPAVIVEMGFINNDSEAQLMFSRKDEFARAIARGITDYFS